jgi:hypothetical protein
MSENQQAGLKLGATPGKLAVVGVLALVMIGVIASNWPSDEAAPVADTVEAAAEAPVATVAESSAAPAADAAAAGPFGEFAVDRHWPERAVKEVAGFDPLAASEWIKPPAAESGPVVSEQQINELLAAENAIIFVAGDKRIARIGDQVFQVGDVVGRYIISDITAKGVVLDEND